MRFNVGMALGQEFIEICGNSKLQHMIKEKTCDKDYDTQHKQTAPDNKISKFFHQ